MNTQITQLRWPFALRQAVVQAARINRRSMNSEILARLEASFPPSVDMTHGHLLPCPCGAGRPCETQAGNGRIDQHFVQCTCGQGVTGITADAAALRWNALVRAAEGRAA